MNIPHTDLCEAEIQILATLRKAELEGCATDRASLERLSERYWIFLEDWAGAFASLKAKELIDGDDNGYRLSDTGRARGDAYHRERPDHYWYYYQRFYGTALASAAHSRHCKQVYGEDLCQEGQMDMAELGQLLDLIQLQAGDALLDLGCGAGVISEYIADRTGARVTGIEYSKPAVAAARERTAGRRSRLRFVHGDLGALDLPARTYDAAIMIDSIYWAPDTAETLTKIADSLRPGARLAIVISVIDEKGEGPEALEADKTFVATALARLNLSYDLHDWTASFESFWPRIKQSVAALRESFEAEGNGFICDALEREADEEFLPALRANALRRYCYLVQF